MGVDFFLALGVGTGLGLLSALGTGGGSLLLLYLTQVLGMEGEQARLLNLMFFLPAAAIATVLHLHQKKLDLPALLPAIAAGCVCAFLTGRFRGQLDTTLLKKGFGVLLLLIAARELTYRRK